ncbi:MAG: hypothetical protein HQL23_07970 [Candidatus Omnitrophica bacterium]|nr:hypothetical protein [Candidatus Omnitrophota bacterium]
MRKLKPALHFFGLRLFWVYLLLGAISWRVMDRAMINDCFQLKLLNDLLPKTYAPLADLAAGKTIPPRELENFFRYFERLTISYPKMAEGYGLLGFCQYYRGKLDDAVNNYDRAMAINQNFFWFPFNRGVIDFRQKKYVDAVRSLQNAILSNPKVVFAAVKSSPRVYARVFLGNPYYNQDLFAQYQEGLRAAYCLLVESLFRLRRYDEAMRYCVEAIENNLNENSYFTYRAGLSAFYSQNYPAAAVFLKKHLDKTSDPGAMRYFGLALREIGQVQTADLILNAAPVAAVSPLDKVADQIQLQPY